MKSWFDINNWIIDKLNIPAAAWAIVLSLVFVFLALLYVGALRGGRTKWRWVLAEMFMMLLWYYGVILLSLLTYWPFGEKKALWTPEKPSWVWLGAGIIIAVMFFLYFRKRKKHFSDRISATAIRRSAAVSGASKFCYALLFGGMSVATLICIARLISGDSIVHLVVPMLTTAICLLLFNLTHWRLFFAAASVMIAVYAVFMLQNVLAKSDFSYTPLLAMIPLFLSAILPLFSLGINKQL